MNHRIYRVIVPFAVLVTAVACSKSDSAGPSASIGAPRPMTPSNGAAIKNADQPVTLAVQNAAVATPTSAAAYTFEVASDAAFTTKVQTKSGVAEGTGQTTVKLDALPAGRDYYWHVLATSGSTTGIFGAVYKFTVGPAIVINTPVPIAPLTGQSTDQRPALRVANATRTGPAGTITYRFEISNTSAFSSVLATAVVSEGVNETGFIPTSDLALNTTFFWRATAIDAANGVTSTPSAVQSFTTNKPSQASLIAAQLGVPLWPRAVPPGSNGHAVMGRRWTVEPLISFDGVRFQNPPIDQLQIFDLLDRGFTPQGAIDWMHDNGYETVGVWYPQVQVIGFRYEYMALVNGEWEIVIRVGA